MGEVVTRGWKSPIHLYELRGGPLRVRLEPDAGERSTAAREVGLESLPALSADLTLTPWLDGAEITGRFQAVVEQLSGVSLEPFEQSLVGEIDVRVVPRGSPHGPSGAGGEIEHDPEAPDPPDLLPGEEVDLSAIVLEHLSLEIDPFARKPGEEFEFQAPVEETSPFAVLKKLKGEEP